MEREGLPLASVSRLALKASAMSQALTGSANKERGGYAAAPVFLSPWRAPLENFGQLRGWAEGSSRHDQGKDRGRPARGCGLRPRSRAIPADQALSGVALGVVASVPSHGAGEGERLQRLAPRRRLIARYPTGHRRRAQLARGDALGHSGRGGGRPPFARIFAPYTGRLGVALDLENSGPVAGAPCARLSRGWKKSRNKKAVPMGCGVRRKARVKVLPVTEQGLGREKSRILLGCRGVRGFGLRHSPVDQGKVRRLGRGRG